MSCGLPVPGPAEPFTLRSIPADQWYHVYCTREHSTTALTFAEGWGDTRFAPITGDDGAAVHTYYVASTPEVAYMESVLHDVVLEPPGLFEVDTLRHYHLATVQVPELVGVSFHSLDLPRLQGLDRARLIDSLPACYPETRAWAQAAYRQQPTALCLTYGSRRNDMGRCLMLFKQRLPDPPLTVLSDELLALSPRRGEVLGLVRSLGIFEI
jgi:RES domain